MVAAAERQRHSGDKDPQIEKEIQKIPQHSKAAWRGTARAASRFESPPNRFATRSEERNPDGWSMASGLPVLHALHSLPNRNR